jgi:hypothetical protein
LEGAKHAFFHPGHGESAGYGGAAGIEVSPEVFEVGSEGVEEQGCVHELDNKGCYYNPPAIVEAAGALANSSKRQQKESLQG